MTISEILAKLKELNAASAAALDRSDGKAYREIFAEYSKFLAMLNKAMANKEEG